MHRVTYNRYAVCRLLTMRSVIFCLAATPIDVDADQNGCIVVSPERSLHVAILTSSPNRHPSSPNRHPSSPNRHPSSPTRHCASIIYDRHKTSLCLLCNLSCYMQQLICIISQLGRSTEPALFVLINPLLYGPSRQMSPEHPYSQD